jgi:outer membrane protein OmpA-like peptidoglycan-associated protein
VPSQDQKLEVAGIAHSLFAGLRIEDRVRIAGGAPRMDWIGGVKFAMTQLAQLGKGQVVLGDKTYAIEGEAISPDAYVQILEANRATLPASLELKSASVTPPIASPYRFAARREPGRVVVEGYASSEKERGTLIDTARRAFGDAAVVDQLAYAGGAPNGYVGAATAAMQAVSRLAGGRAEITDGKVVISGGAYTEAAESDVLAGVSDTTPEGFSPESAIVVRQPDQPVSAARCRELLQVALQAGRIEFEGDKSDIAGQSEGVLDRVAAILQRCPDTNVEIAAHTDSDGSTGRNKTVSEDRASAIVEFLVNGGVKRERLSGTGYGESKPIADNSTSAGKAQNRRIEFTMIAPGEAAAAPAETPAEP